MLRSRDGSMTAAIRRRGDGSYRIGNLPSGDYVIGRAYGDAGRRSMILEVTLAEGEDKEVDIEVSQDSGKGYDGYLVVNVVTDKGLLLPGTRVWLEGQGGIVESSYELDERRAFGAYAGIYTLVAEYPGYRTVRQRVEIKSKEERSTQEILEPLIIRMVKK